MNVIYCIFMISVSSFLSGMQLQPFPRVERDELFLVESDKKSYKLSPHSVWIYKKNLDEKEQKTIYHYEHVVGIVLNKYNRIAPYKFCKKIASLAQDNKISTPIIPFVSAEKLKFDIASDHRFNIIFFSESYVQDKNLPYLRFFVGHELGHGDHWTEKYEKAYHIACRIVPSFIFNSVSFVALTGLSVDNLLIVSPFLLYFGLKTLGSAFFIYTINDSINICQNIEFACDIAAIEKFGKSYRQKISIAEEGIKFFQVTDLDDNEDQNIMAKIWNFWSNGFDRHPSHNDRIQRLEAIKEYYQELANISKEKTC